MWRRLTQWPGLGFALVFAWKLALLVFTAQPVPANDSFFYDGPVVNLLRNGQYTNPSLVETLPISGTKVFSAYPPLYQFVLLGWMKFFGTSALAAMWLHLALYATYMLTLFAILRRVNAPVWGIHLAGVFLLTNTFHDRPDSLVHTLGMAAIFFRIRGEAGNSGGGWLPAILALLGVTTGPVVGAMYLFIIFGMTCFHFSGTRRISDLFPAVAMVVLPLLMIAAVALGRPDWWAGFMEHARQTPSLSKLRLPQVVDAIKVIRTVPGILAVLFLTALLGRKLKRPTGDQRLPVWTGGMATLAATGVVGGCLLFLTANLVHVAGYLQPLIVGCFLALLAPRLPAEGKKSRYVGLFVLLGLLSSIRAIGQTTWGVVCARDVSYSDAVRMTSKEFEELSEDQPVIVSAAYLYEASWHRNARVIHSDWLCPMNREATLSFTEAFVKLRPQKLVLTQFDYYRRYNALLEEVKGRSELKTYQVFNAAKTPAPDSFPAMQKVVQHVSWAPIVVTLSWKSPGERP